MTGSMDSAPMFFFGTLMDQDVLELVTGQAPSGLEITPAVAIDVVKRVVVNETYPVLVAQTEGRAVGVVVSGLTAGSLERILFFEGEEYGLHGITVETGDARRVASRYFADNEIDEHTDQAWDLDRWRREEKAEFLTQTRRYMQHFGAMSTIEADAFWTRG